MKIMRPKRFFAFFLLTLCLCALLPQPTATAAGDKMTMTVSSSTIPINEQFTLSCPGATFIVVSRVDGQWSNTYRGESTSLAMGWSGDYLAYGTNSTSTSNTVYFTITMPTTTPSVSATLTGPSTVRAGDTITLTFSLNGTGLLGAQGVLAYDENQVTMQSTSVKIKAPWKVIFRENNFLAYEDGLQDQLINSNTALFTITFKVKNVTPGSVLTICYTDVKATASYTTNLGTISYSADIQAPITAPPTTATTTKPTTIPTTATPSTTTTTKPTTIPTTKPTTVKPSVQNPCASGHHYQNGFCIYCAKADPNYNPCLKGHSFENGFCIRCGVQDPRYDPCANGHTYENGWCVYCSASDPSTATTQPVITQDPCAVAHGFVNGFCVRCAKTDLSFDPCESGHTFLGAGCISCGAEAPAPASRLLPILLVIGAGLSGCAVLLILILRKKN